MKIKIMYPNRDGRLEFSKNELEKLLEEAYNEGYKDGKNSNSYTIKDCNYYPSVAYMNEATCRVVSADSDCSTATIDDSIKVSRSTLNNIKVSGSTLNNYDTVSLGAVDSKGNVE